MRKKISKIALVAVLTTSLATISQVPLQANASFWGRFKNLFRGGKIYNAYSLLNASQGIKQSPISRGSWSRKGIKGYGSLLHEGTDGSYRPTGNNPPDGFYRQLKEKD